MRDHTTLRAFELADEVALLTYQVTANFPKDELYGLTAQMRWAAVSVRELHYQLGLSKRLGFLNEQDIPAVEEKIVETEKVLNGLIGALKNA